VKAGCVKLKEGSGRINFSVLVSDEKTDLLRRGKRWSLKAFGIMWWLIRTSVDDCNQAFVNARQRMGAINHEFRHAKEIVESGCFLANMG
jgi:hypothetical protein